MNNKAEHSSEREVVAANPRARWRVLTLFAVLTVVMFITLLALRSYLQKQLALADLDPAAAAENVVGLLRWLTVALAAVLVALAGWLGWLGTRVLQTGQYPPPGASVLRDTRIRRGGLARCTGAAALLLSVALLVFGTYGAWRFQYIASRVVQQQLAPIHSVADSR